MTLTNITHDAYTRLKYHPFITRLPMILSLTVPAMPLFHTDTGTLQSIDHPNSATGSLPLSLHCHQEQPHLQAIASQIMLHEEQTFLCLAVFCDSFPLNCNALKWCVWCLNVDLPVVLFAKSSTTVPDDGGRFGIFYPCLDCQMIHFHCLFLCVDIKFCL